MTLKALGLFDEPAEVRVQLRSAPGDIHRRYIGLLQCTDTEFGRLAGHALHSIRSGIDVTMPTGLVTELPDVDLKHGDTGRAERSEANRRQSFSKRLITLGLRQHLKLALSGGQRVVATQ
jgi:hypothetical protein